MLTKILIRGMIVPFVLAASACNLGTDDDFPELPPPLASDTPAPTATPEPPTAVPPTPTPLSVSRLPDPAGYRWSLVADGFQKPLAIEHAGDERIFVVEQRGVIWVIENGSVRPQPLLDIRDRVNRNAFEQGLLGLAFDPDFTRNGRFFVNYTRSGGDTLVSSFIASVTDTLSERSTEKQVLSIDQPFSNHNGGNLQFGPDGMLYIGTGDGGSADDPHGFGQRLDTLLGKLLRLDVNTAESYVIPGDNPFAGGGGQPEIWAYGLRNPWRFSFDSFTGDLYIGDVGQDRWEEINFLQAGSPGGANFGWNHREGMHPFASQVTEGLTDPVTEYRNGGGSCSVTGGVVVRAPELPQWAGVYLYGDYCTGQILGLVRDESGQWLNSVMFDTRFNISSFGVGFDGAVYLADHNGGIYRLEPIQ